MSERLTRSQLGAAKGSEHRTVSHGRGGAGKQNSHVNIQPEVKTPLTGCLCIGNLGKESASDEPANLDTPTIKSDKYTTGRGGSGNIATNDPNAPEVARAAQDVAAVQARESQGTVHIGRGGAANTAKPGEILREGDHKKGVVNTILEKVGLKK